MNKTIYLVRHGCTVSNQRGVYAGSSKEGLTEKGAAHADALGRKMAKWGIESIYTSPVGRAVQTAEILNKHIGAELTVEPDLDEMKLGPWEGLSENVVAQRYPNELRMWQSQPSKLRLRERETLEDIQSRAVNAINKISEHHFCTTSLAVTHVAVIRCLIMHFRKLDLDTYKKINIPNLCTHQLLFQNGLFMGVEQIEAISHS